MATKGKKGTQRKLTAILSADVVGYSRLMGDDEEATLDTLTTYRKVFTSKIKKHRGRVVDAKGDSILAEFASVVDAVNSAVEIQRELFKKNDELSDDRRMDFRIGINLGDVIVKDDVIYGDGVNIAARLEALAEPGGICISGDVFRQCRGKIDIGFEDLGEREVKNIAEPVHAFAVRLEHESAVAGEQRSIETLPLPVKPSIAVLPFENMSGDPEQEYFTDGITEDIITELSRFRTLFVIARNSSFVFRGKGVDVTEVGRKLGVQYVLEGSVRKASNRVRITAQLIDAPSSHHIWAERYDRDLDDIFALQDEITRAIVSALPEKLEVADRERARQKQTANMTAYDLVLLGLAGWKGLTLQGIAEARHKFQQAVELDPKYVRAHANLAWTHVCEVFLVSGNEDSLDEAYKHAQIALALDDNDSWCHGVIGQLFFLLHRDEESEKHFGRALALNSNDADIAAFFAIILVYWGRWEEALEWITTAKRLNPSFPSLYHWYHALALYSAREYEQAIRTFREITELNFWGHAYIAASYAQMDRLEEANAELDKFVTGFQRQTPIHGSDAQPATLEIALQRRADRYRIPSERKHFLEGVHKAGLPQ